MNIRLRELDSLRGIAIILVMTGHISKRALYFSQNEVLHFITQLTYVGWVGVDIFFVLSGFLITSILLRTREEKDYFKNFYVRRVLRIFPLYFVFLAVFIILCPLLDPGYLPQLPGVLPYLLLYLQNWILLSDKYSLSLYLFVTWSLAIEEQFYMVWPAIVYFARRERLVKICAGVIIFSILGRIACIYLWNNTSLALRFIYQNTFTRFEELVFGALLAIAFTYPVWKDRVKKISLPVFLVSLSVFISLCVWVFPNLYPTSTVIMGLGIYTPAAVFSTALIAMLVTYSDNSPIRRLFQNRILAFFGKYSYSMYLLHLPVAMNLLDPLWHTRIRGWKMYLLYMALTYGITILGSLLTWHLLEKRMLDLKKYFEYAPTKIS